MNNGNRLFLVKGGDGWLFSELIYLAEITGDLRLASLHVLNDRECSQIAISKTYLFSITVNDLDGDEDLDQLDKVDNIDLMNEIILRSSSDTLSYEPEYEEILLIESISYSVYSVMVS